MNMLENVCVCVSLCVCVCVPGSNDRLTECNSELKDRRDYRQQHATSGCQVALETEERNDRKLKNRKEKEA